MKKLLPFMRVVLGTTIALLTLCTGGNDSGIDNVMIAGKLFEPDGKTPAQGVHMVVRYKNSIASILSDAAPDAEVLYSTFTDKNGNFAIDTIDDGLYVIEGSDQKGNAVLIDSINIAFPATPLLLPDDTLKPAGKISGVIRLTGGGNYQQVFVLAFGMDRFCQVREDGNFTFEGFAEGIYNLKIISLEQRYTAFDTSNVHVPSGKTVWLDTISLLENGMLPIPQDFKATYDKEVLKTTLSWSATPAAITKGYHVYRKSDIVNVNMYPPEPAEGIRLNSDIITETRFVDSTITDFLWRNDSQMVRYFITMVDTNGFESMISDEQSIFFTSAWKLVTSIQLDVPVDFAISDLFVDSKNRIHLMCSTSEMIEYYRVDCYGQIQLTWKISYEGNLKKPDRIIGVGSDDNVWLYSWWEDSLQIKQMHAYTISSTGTILDTILIDTDLHTSGWIDHWPEDVMIYDDSLLSWIYDDKLTIMNIKDKKVTTSDQLAATSGNGRSFIPSFDDTITICSPFYDITRILKMSENEMVFTIYTEITEEPYYPPPIGVRHDEDGNFLVYYEDYYYKCEPSGKITKKRMPLFYGTTAVLSDGAVVKFIKTTQQPDQDQKLMFLKFVMDK